MNTRNTDIGVIVGRFQTARLHDAHIDLIKTVCEKHAKVIIVLGLSAIVATKNNPLDYAMRKKMIEAAFPDVTILYINDNQSDETWSANLDRILRDPHIVGTGKTVTLYGSRDSFLRFYKGKHKQEELIPTITVSATEMRRLSGTRVKDTQDFREGVVWATQNRYPAVFPTVDIAVIDRKSGLLLLGRKSTETLYRFIGGFVDPEVDTSLQQAAARELKEEARLTIDPAALSFAGSTIVNDWRYRNEVDKIMTTLWVGEYTIGEARAGDDIAATKWAPIALGVELKKQIVPEHHILVDMLFQYLGNTV